MHFAKLKAKKLNFDNNINKSFKSKRGFINNNLIRNKLSNLLKINKYSEFNLDFNNKENYFINNISKVNSKDNIINNLN